MKDRDIDFLYEIGSLRFIDRTWRQFISPGFANLSEHTLRVAWIALVLARASDIPGIDMGRLMLMAMVHDVAESRTGDVNYLQRHYVQRNEVDAVRDIADETSIEAEILAAWTDYHEGLSTEAKLVRDADRLDVDLEIHEQRSRGSTLSFARVRDAVRAEGLTTEVGRNMWDRIATSDPDTWHTEAAGHFGADSSSAEVDWATE